MGLLPVAQASHGFRRNFNLVPSFRAKVMESDVTVSLFPQSFASTLLGIDPPLYRTLLGLNSYEKTAVPTCFGRIHPTAQRGETSWNLRRPLRIEGDKLVGGRGRQTSCAVGRGAEKRRKNKDTKEAVP